MNSIIKQLMKTVTVIPLMLGLLYAGGYITQFIVNYKSWDLAHSLGDGTAPDFPSSSFGTCLKALFIFPYGLYGFLICILLFGFFAFMIMRMVSMDKGTHDKERNLTYSDRGDFGTSGFMTEKEMHNVLDLVKDVKTTDATILGKLGDKAICVPTDSRMNKNIAVYGASGSMKSRGFVRNMVFQCVKRGESLVITDPKSELYEDMAVYLENEGYNVKAFNLVNPEHSDSWNCLGEIGGEELMAQLFTDVIIKNTGSEKGDHFWDNAETNLLKALVLYVERGFPPEGKNIGQVYKLLTSTNEKELNSLFDMLPISHPAKAPFSIFKQASDSVRAGVIIGLGSRLQVFQNQLIRDITSHNEINITKAGTEKCAYFCITSDQDSTFDFLSSLFMSFVFIKLVRYADKHGKSGRLPVPVHILADELANIGVIPDLTKKISTIRSRGLSLSCIFQNLPQMQNRYPLNQWQEIIGNCDSQLFLGCTDDLTAEFISSRCGEITINTFSQAKQLNSWRVSNYTPDYRETYAVNKRRLLTKDEILRFPLDKALIILRGQKVLEVEKYDFSLHPESHKMEARKVKDHIPEWRRNSTPEDTYVEQMKIPKGKTTVRGKRNHETEKNMISKDKSSQAPSKAEKKQKIQTSQYEAKLVTIDKDSILS